MDRLIAHIKDLWPDAIMVKGMVELLKETSGTIEELRVRLLLMRTHGMCRREVFTPHPGSQGLKVFHVTEPCSKSTLTHIHKLFSGPSTAIENMMFVCIHFEIQPLLVVFPC